FGSAANHAYYCETVAEACPQAPVVFQQLFFNLFSGFSAFLQQALFFFVAFGEDVVEFVLLVVEVVSAFVDEGVGLFDFFLLGGDEFFGFLASLVAALELQFLLVFLLGDGVALAVVTTVLLLFGVFLDAFLSFLRRFPGLLDAFFPLL